MNADPNLDDAKIAEIEDVAADPTWRVLAWALPLCAGLSAILAAGQALFGGLDALVAYPCVLVLAGLCALLARDLRRRIATGRWVRTEVFEYAAPLCLLLVALFLLTHGAALATYAPLLLALIPTAWAVIHAPRSERVMRLWPRALPMAGDEVDDGADDGIVEAIVRDVLADLPPDIAAQLEGWTVEVREELRPSPRGQIVFGLCTPATRAITIYRRPHLRHGGRGAALRQSVAYTTLHEIAHALGLDEHGVRRLGPLAMSATPASPASHVDAS